MCNNKKFNKKLKQIQQRLQLPVEKLQPPTQKPLQPQFKRFNTTLLEPSGYELDIIKCKKNLAVFPKGHDGILIGYYKARIEYNQNKIDTAHAYLIEVSSPSHL